MNLPSPPVISENLIDFTETWQDSRQINSAAGLKPISTQTPPQKHAEKSELAAANKQVPLPTENRATKPSKEPSADASSLPKFFKPAVPASTSSSENTQKPAPAQSTKKQQSTKRLVTS